MSQNEPFLVAGVGRPHTFTTLMTLLQGIMIADIAAGDDNQQRWRVLCGVIKMNHTPFHTYTYTQAIKSISSSLIKTHFGAVTYRSTAIVTGWLAMKRTGIAYRSGGGGGGSWQAARTMKGICRTRARLARGTKTRYTVSVRNPFFFDFSPLKRPNNQNKEVCARVCLCHCRYRYRLCH